MRFLRAVSCALFLLAAFACGKSSSTPDDGIPLPDRAEDSGTDTGTPAIEDSGPSVDAATDQGADTGPPGTLRVFVTSTTFKGRFGGLIGADATCNDLAKAAGLPGTFVAWLSVQNGPHAVDRLTSGGPWSLVSGEVVASKAELLNPPLKHAIDRDETGAVVQATQVWTGTGITGRYLTNDCDKWTTGNDGRVGRSDQVTAEWTTANVIDCDNLRRLYCFQL